jgi:hypothetical protein
MQATDARSNGPRPRLKPQELRLLTSEDVLSKMGEVDGGFWSSGKVKRPAINNELVN